MLKQWNVKISMDGKGRFMDNIFIERLWRTLKYERIYLRTYETGTELSKDLTDWLTKAENIHHLTSRHWMRRPYQGLKLAA